MFHHSSPFIWAAIIAVIRTLGSNLGGVLIDGRKQRD
jgi:hypothetical protein